MSGKRRVQEREGKEAILDKPIIMGALRWASKWVFVANQVRPSPEYQQLQRENTARPPFIYFAAADNCWLQLVGTPELTAQAIGLNPEFFHDPQVTAENADLLLERMVDSVRFWNFFLGVGQVKGGFFEAQVFAAEGRSQLIPSRKFEAAYLFPEEFLFPADRHDGALASFYEVAPIAGYPEHLLIPLLES